MSKELKRPIENNYTNNSGWIDGSEYSEALNKYIDQLEAKIKMEREAEEYHTSLRETEIRNLEAKLKEADEQNKELKKLLDRAYNHHTVMVDDEIENVLNQQVK